MKKTALILSALALSLFVSCSKPEKLVQVSFSVGVESGPMTRAFSESLADALSQSVPPGPFSLKAQSKTNELRSYSVTTGSPIQMAVDSYDVTGSGKGSVVAEVTQGEILSYPAWSVNSSVTIEEDGGTYSVPASYTCVAIAVDKTKVEKIVIMSGANEVTVTDFGGNEEAGVVFVKCTGTWTASKPLWVYVYPLDRVNCETALYKFINTANDVDGFVRVRNGYWYALVPGDVEVASGSMGIDFGAWNEGAL